MPLKSGAPGEPGVGIGIEMVVLVAAMFIEGVGTTVEPEVGNWVELRGLTEIWGGARASNGLQETICECNSLKQTN